MTNDNKKPRLTLKNAAMMAFSLLCALLLWVYVTSTEGDNYTDSFSGVNVVFEGENTMREARGLVITSRGSSTVRVSLTGSRRSIAQLDASKITAVIDLSTISGAGVYTSSYKINYPAGFDGSALTVNYKTPENITFVVDKLNTKQIEVEGVFNGSAAEGYSAEPLQFEPNSVRISGPTASLEKVDHAWVEINRENVDRTLTIESDYVLCDADGNVIEDDAITLESGTVTVTLPITAIKEVELSLNFLPGGGATSDNVKWEIDPKKITLSGDADVLAGINTIQVETVDLAEVDETASDTVAIVIPNDTEILIGPKDATYTVEVRGLEKKTVRVTNITCKNCTEGYSAEIISENLDVIIRGEKSALEAISDVNVRAVADLADYGSATGVVSVPVSIYIDGSTSVGAVGIYNVYINVTRG
jgi:YbbR domain-containing protein